MALYTDSPVFTIEELAAHETSILDMASTEGIDLTTKITLARDEVGMELLVSLQRIGDESAEIGLDKVVVTAPLRLWQIFHTLAIVYRDAYYSQLNDRYKNKWQEYKNLTKWAAGILYQIGVGTVGDPIPEAPAPSLAAVPGAIAIGTYFARATWVSANGEEGSAGAIASLVITTGNTLRATLSDQPSSAVSWNLYAGLTPHDLFLQTAPPLPAGTAWQATGPLTLTGPRPGSGQDPDLLRQVPRVVLRG